MTLNAKIGVLWIFGDFGLRESTRQISRANCVEFTTHRLRQVAYEIFSIERRFQRSKLRFSRFKETCAQGHQRAVPHKSRYFAVVGKSTVKKVVDRHGCAVYHNKP